MIFKKKETEKSKEEKKMENQVTETPVSEKKEKKAKKKGKKKWIIIAAVVVVIGIIAVSGMKGKEVKIPVNVTQALKGDITQTVESSGVVASEEEKVYFSEVSGTVTDLKVVLGADVKAGDNVVSYDLADLETELKKVELETKANNYGIDATVTSLNESQRKASEAATNYEDAKKYVAHYSDCVSQINGQLSKATELSNQAAALEAEIAEVTKKLAAKPESEKLQEKLESKQKELKKVKKELSNYNVTELQSALEVCAGDLEAYKALEKQYEAEKEADPSIGSQKAQQSALKEVSNLTAAQAKENYQKAQAGVTIDFNGIVSSVDVVKGQTVTEGTPLFTVKNSEKVKATIAVSKYDLEKIAIGQKAKVTINGNEYDGTLSNLNKIAQANQSGTPMVNVDIHIENPDDKIFIGVEAKVYLETAKKEQVLLIPIECVNSDTKGEFCWVIVDGVATRKDIEIGISDDTYTEVVSGLNEGEQVVTDMTVALEEGMTVMAIEAGAEESTDAAVAAE